MSDSSIKIVLKNTSKHFGKVCALDAINIQFAPGTLTTLLGPSGCGKTTLLRLVSGLEPVTSGEIWFGDENVTQLSATRRDVGMVFQSYALFPHMTVEKNVGYGLGVLKTAPDETRERVRGVLKMVDMDGYQSRYPDELSGGQQQRVAVARAMVLRPKVLLFDEPLSNIDSKLRRSMRDDIRRLQQASGITSIYVTHDQAEALAVSDEIIIMRKGAIEQQGPPQDFFEIAAENRLGQNLVPVPRGTGQSDASPFNGRIGLSQKRKGNCILGSQHATEGMPNRYSLGEVFKGSAVDRFEGLPQKDPGRIGYTTGRANRKGEKCLHGPIPVPGGGKGLAKEEKGIRISGVRRAEEIQIESGCFFSLLLKAQIQ